MRKRSAKKNKPPKVTYEPYAPGEYTAKVMRHSLMQVNGVSDDLDELFTKQAERLHEELEAEVGTARASAEWDSAIKASLAKRKAKGAKRASGH